MSRRVLIVDDNEDVRQILSWRLRRAGFDVSGAPDGRTGLALLRAGHWDLVLLDLLMPEMDGFEFLAAVQTDPLKPPVVVITQYDDPESCRRAMALGATSYFGKSSALERTFPRMLSSLIPRR
jgi:CheY-like chemotaxis protein